MPIPVNIQIQLIAKILPFDRNITRFSGKINLYIVYQSSYRVSVNVKNEIANTMESNKTIKIDGKKINIIYVDLQTTNLESEMKKNGAGVVYITHLRAYDLEIITGITSKHKSISITGIPEYKDNGVSITLDSKGGKSEIIINRNASKSEGCDFSAQLLKLATVID